MKPEPTAKFAEVAAALAEMFNLSGQEVSALHARIKHYHRLNFLPGVKRGNGRSGQYTLDEAVMTATAIDLSLSGITPERVIEMLVPRQDRILAAAKRGADYSVQPRRALSGSLSACRITVPAATMRAELLRRLATFGEAHG